MSMHTPGPWVWADHYTLRPAKPAPERSAVHTILSPDGCFGYVEKTWREIEPEDDANRALIAAAPELLAALRELHQVVTDMDLNVEAERPSEARYQRALLGAAEAIARATAVRVIKAGSL